MEPCLVEGTLQVNHFGGIIPGAGAGYDKDHWGFTVLVNKRAGKSVFVPENFWNFSFGENFKVDDGRGYFVGKVGAK